MTAITINAPADRVWRALTTPSLIKQWLFGVDTKSDWKKGSPIVHTGEWKGKAYEDKGVILEIEPSAKLVHSHWSSMSGRPDKPANYEKITYRLKERNGATELTIDEENIASAEQRSASEESWKKALGGLKALVEKG